MALVISLIMLSVTLVMAVAFLALSRRERAAVTTTTDTATARLAAESAVAAAQAQIAASIWTTNIAAGNFGLLVSTNFINENGFVPGLANPTNVSYVYPNGNPLTAADLAQNVANLWFQPRVPVFVQTNQAPYGNDFRFFLDLNRNGRFEGSGLLPVISSDPVNPYFDTNGNTMPAIIAGNTLSNAIPGDPEWIGVLERPDQPHGPNNKFVSRYAFLAQPIGNSLDLNYIHNQVFNTGLAAADGYFRNQAAGSWEMNLAAFLADLNTNQWNPPLANYYQYNRALSGFANSGYAFEDARAMLSWRYGYNYNNLASANNFFANAGNVIPFDNIDNYGDGPLQTGIPGVNETIVANQDKPNLPWAGADNPNRFFALTSDLFDAAKSSPAFVNRLQFAGSLPATYDRYTFYRMLDQLGTDSVADDDRMNLNYKNIVNGGVVPGMETNQIPWTALDFFTNAADRLLRYHTARWLDESRRLYTNTPYGRDYTNTFGAVNNQPFGIDRIPVYVEGRMVYTPAVNRLLQLAANLYDASTNSFFPSVFRPEFVVSNTASGHRDIYITGYHSIGTVGAIGNAPLDAPLDVTAAASLNTVNPVQNTPNANLYGVPWIIGAKKGFPSFNQFYMRSLVSVTRKLEVTRNDPKTPGALATNQMLLMGITNRIGYSFWNSYNNDYVPASGSVRVYFRDITSMTLSNGVNQWQTFYGGPNPAQFAALFVTNRWPGSAWSGGKPEDQNANARSFVSGYWDYEFLPVSHYVHTAANFEPVSTATWETGIGYVPKMPDLQFIITNRVQAFILDGNRVIDYVQLFGPNGGRNINTEINDTGSPSAGYWNTNLSGGGGAFSPSWGVINQIQTAKNPPAGSGWKTPPDMPAYVKTPKLAGDYFAAFFTGAPVTYLNGVPQYNTNLALQVPYTPSRYSWDLTLWQANDPLVHYLGSDLASASPNAGQHRADSLTGSAFGYSNPRLNEVTDRYQPWGRYREMSAATGVDQVGEYNLRLHDPLVWNSDAWNFPFGKYPSAGWLGRVHRGTPWQTVYLKPNSILNQGTVGTNTWAQWTGNTAKSFGKNYDAAHSAPVEDSALFDLFTTRLNDNAARGGLSVNAGAGQPDGGLASWSAVLSGLVALTNITDVPTIDPLTITNFIIPPAGPEGSASAIGRIVKSINDTRSSHVNASGVKGTFERVGDILRVPALTVESPFINFTERRTGEDDRRKYDIPDELYEWLPQQIVGLLRVNPTPRYVIYCYGQALRPAPESFVTDAGANFGLCTNYQVVAEQAARAVVRVNRQVVNGNTNYTTTVESYNPLPPD